MRVLSEIAVMEAHFEEILTRTYINPEEYTDEVTDKHKRLYMYELQCDLIIKAIRVFGHMMEDHPNDLDEEIE